MGLMDGLKNFAHSPLRLLTGSVNPAAGGPLTADGPAVGASLSATSTPLRTPVSQEGGLFGAGGSPQAKSGAQAAMMSYPTNGAGSW